MTEATITTTRPAVRSRWIAALARARAEGITLSRNDEREYFALSSDGQRLSPVSLQGCSCKAGQQGNVCKHSAALRAALHLLSDDQPMPERPVRSWPSRNAASALAVARGAPTTAIT